jgi:hypothetical protein
MVIALALLSWNLRLRLRWQIVKTVVDPHMRHATSVVLPWAFPTGQLEFKRNFDMPVFAKVIDRHAEKYLFSRTDAYE